MHDQILSVSRVLILLFAIVDPFGNIPVFLSITSDDSEAFRRRTAAKACIVSFCVLAAFTLFGDQVLELFGVTMPAFQVAGGIVLALFSLPMLAATRAGSRLLASEEEEGAAKHDVSIVPMAVPMMAGPGAITAVMVMSANRSLESPHATVIACAGGVVLASFVLFLLAGGIARKVGATGLNVMTRIMGLIILVIAVQFVMEGAKAFFAA